MKCSNVSILVILALAFPALAAAQPIPVPFPLRPQVVKGPAASTAEAVPADEKPATPDREASATGPAPAPANPKQFRFLLIDGSVLTGELLIDQLQVETKYGSLAVPLTDVQSFTPGLSSHPDLARQIDANIEHLGDDDFKAREQAQRELARFGPAIRHLLDARTNDENAERRRRIRELAVEIDDQAEVRSAFEEARGHEGDWIRNDTVVTGEFTAVGKIAPATLNIQSKYGAFTLQLADVRRAEREANQRPAFYKSVTVEGTNLAPSAFKETGIKLQKGDRITVRADGTLSLGAVTGDSDMAATADGDMRFGWYVPSHIRGGALVGRIGRNGSIFLVGKSKSFVAEADGELALAVGVPPEYSMGDSIALPGAFNVKLKIEPR